MGNKQKGLFSVVFLLNMLVFLIAVDLPSEKLIEFGTINIADTKQKSKIYNLEKIVENNLNNPEEDPVILKSKVNIDLIAFFKNNLHVCDIINNTQEKIDIISLNLMTHVIVYKPSKHTIVKKYIITTDINKTKYLCFYTDTINYKTKYLFPKLYEKEVVVYK
jgi:hypothetical protein